MSAYGATVAKRRLARRLTELRTENGYTANQVCDHLSWGRGKVGRFEANAWKRPELSDIRDLLHLYRVGEGEWKEIEELAIQARARPWWREYADVFGDTEFPGYESDSTRICLYMPLIIPGLLQTAPYSEAHMLVGKQPPAWRRRALETRRRRQAILDRDDGSAPDVVAVITEASLLYRWGTQEQRRAQVCRLVEMSRRAGVEVRMLRFVDGPHPGMCAPINIFDFPGAEPQSVYLETDFTIQQVLDPEEVGAYVETFGRARDAALDPAATTAYLKQLAERLD